MLSPIIPGDFVTYAGRSGAIAGGIVAERAISPLTLNPRFRVVDFASEAADPDAGRWVDVMHLLGAYPAALVGDVH